MGDAEYAAMLLWSVEPTDRALAGWGDWQHKGAARWLAFEAECAAIKADAKAKESATGRAA